jgi:ferredoxin
MKMMKIQHFRQDCIGCNACVQYAPQTWAMNEADGKVDLIEGVTKGDIVTADLLASDLDANRKASACCPVRIIKIMGH